MEPSELDLRIDRFTLVSGVIVAFQYPSELSLEDYQDIEGWMGIQMRKLKRHVSVDIANPLFEPEAANADTQTKGPTVVTSQPQNGNAA
jgi:hypothetical protein